MMAGSGKGGREFDGDIRRGYILALDDGQAMQ
jgi:hypothetical protein